MFIWQERDTFATLQLVGILFTRKKHYENQSIRIKKTC